MPIKFSKSAGGGIPSGSSNERPTNPEIGDQFYNGTLGILEIYSPAGWVPSTGANDFNVSLSAGETSVTFDRSFFAGSYTISSAAGDTSFDVYLFDENGNRVGYSGNPSISASADFNKVVIIGGTTGDLLGFSYKTTFTSQSTTTDFKTSPYITSRSSEVMSNVNDTTTIYGGNFANDVEVYFVNGSGAEVPAKSFTRVSATEISVTRPDVMPEQLGPYTIKAVNPGVPEASGSNRNKLMNSVSPKTASGGTETTISGYRIHTFTGNGTLTFNQPVSVEYMIIAGGGGGGNDMGGGGGAGGYLAGTTQVASSGPQTIIIGAGGLGSIGAYGVSSYAAAGITKGNNSSALSLTALGGGHGACNHRYDNYPALPATSGGSGGGASGKESGSWAAGTSGQGNNGGSTAGEWYAGGGGGSASAGVSGGVGGAIPSGGAGTLNNILGTPYYWAAGGGGSGYTGAAGNGGIGGGGAGAGGTGKGIPGGSSINPAAEVSGSGAGNGPVGSNAGANTGSGGGGGSHQSSGRNGNGGSGIVVIRYAIPA